MTTNLAERVMRDFIVFHYPDTPVLRSLPSVITLNDLFKNYLSIQGVPKRYFFELLSHFTNSELEEERLLEFCSAEGQVTIYHFSQAAAICI